MLFKTFKIELYGLSAQLPSGERERTYLVDIEFKDWKVKIFGKFVSLLKMWIKLTILGGYTKKIKDETVQIGKNTLEYCSVSKKIENSVTSWMTLEGICYIK